MWSDGIPRPTPRSERSIQVKIARKNTRHIGKKIPGRLCEVLDLGKTVRKSGPTTSFIRVPNRLEVRV